MSTSTRLAGELIHERADETVRTPHGGVRAVDQVTASTPSASADASPVVSLRFDVDDDGRTALAVAGSGRRTPSQPLPVRPSVRW